MNAPHGDLRKKTVRGLIWQFMGVGGQQIMTLVGMSVISRNLDLPDVSLFAILLTGIGMLESLTLFMGEQSTIASPRGHERRYLDTVFTVRVLRSIVISLLLCALAPGFAWYFQDDKIPAHYWLTGLFLAMAATGFFDGLQSPARAARLKSLSFRRVVACDFVANLLGTTVTIVLAIALKNVWALLIGHVATTTFRSILSYVAAPHMPRFVLDKEALRDIVEYSKGAAGAPFLLFVTAAAPAMIVGKLIMNMLAVFEYAARLTKIPENIFLRVLGPVAIPAYAQLRHDLPRLATAWLGAVRAFLLIGAPMMVAMGWCGGALPALVFGNAYGGVDSLFVLQCAYGGLAGLTAVVGPLFWAIGQPHRDRRAQFVRCVTIYALGVPFTLWWGIVGFAVAACISITAALVLCVVQAQRVLSLPFVRVLAAMRQGALVATGLATALLLIDLAFAPEGLVRIVTAGAASGPLLATIVLRLMRQRRGEPVPEIVAVDATS